MLSTLKANHSEVGTIGAANTVAVSVPGIRADDVILAIIRWKAGEAPAGVAVASFAASDGSILSASVSTVGYYLTVIWAHRN